ncbi:PDZ and LIM domain protein 7 isoform X41 [Tympanuchus pallidicinctus]|uniref:PDZ and LIM domain protein 7 isoform X39 n=1 Tax=Tympanuchus pallidicinctus TaxID=109042 RepID=UPI0022872970|nr:PDZ and LIM domain protein 7 isoform X39 [Tympanuchus pallidicinctus]XP_052541015.1 PDZ and LIM domain protein 7 isoform X40 [Tympanuchus pallidicinctus]XP_052541016.1 PDZ and LIM domain protein 7 isoform X41 [Tympanuchus pallidicinctus]
MGEMESYKVMLNGPAPWGFRLQGGKDFSMPLSISRLTPGGKAAQAGVGVGDWVLYIDGESTSAMTHIEAQNRIRACGDRLCLTLSRAQNHLGKPQKDSLPCSEPLKYNFAPSTALNKTARPFGAGSPPNPRPGLVTKPVTYVPLAPACTPQHNGKPQEHPSSPKYDPSKLHLIEDSEDWQPRNTSTQSRSFLKLAQLTGTDSFEDHEDELVRKPRGPRVSFWGTEEEWQSMHPPGTPTCDPGKLRLMEDAEDWQPRTGTSQSRSFRKLARLTGTDGLEDREDELVRKPRDARGSFCGTEEQWQPPPHVEPPTTPACDPGKLRLFEDAEDWQPRTGTSQSRSFRKLARLTGTDGLEDDDVFIKKPSQVSVPDPSPGAAMKTEPGLASRTPAATPGPTSRPPWAVDPSFAERYAPDKTSTVLSKHSQPATPTPMQNRSSIVQAAQQAPEGPGRTPLCYKCNKIIRGRYLVALGHYYHPEEFTCCQCRKVLDEGGFFEEKGSIFCPKCYDTRYAPSCAKCKKKITGEVMHALKMTWHVQCFTCAACKTPIRNRAFYMEEGQPYCERDYEKMFGTKCRGCDFKIDAGDRFLEALGFSWHDTCFVCAICQTNLEGKTFYSKKDKPLCKSHAFSHV